MKKQVMLMAAVLGSMALGAPSKEVLVILSGVDYVSLKDGGHHPTGYFLTELATPLAAIRKAGYRVTFASPGGRAPVMDKVSDSVRWFRSEAEYRAAKQLIANLGEAFNHPRVLSSIAAEELVRFRGVFLPGGHAPMEDLYRDADLGHVLHYFHAQAKPTALICHAPIALLSAAQDSEWIYSGYRMTVFSTAEEKQEEEAGHLDGYLTFYVQAALENAGGRVAVAKPWSSHVVRDRELITGQNPMSDHEFASALVKALEE